jgi:hypothetical protein
MKRKLDGRSQAHRFGRIAFVVSVFVVAAMIAILASVPLMGLAIICVAAGQLALGLGGMVSALVMCLLSLQVFTPLVYAAVSGDWIALIALLPALVDWLRSIGLL